MATFAASDVNNAAMDTLHTEPAIRIVRADVYFDAQEVQSKVRIPYMYIF